MSSGVGVNRLMGVLYPLKGDNTHWTPLDIIQWPLDKTPLDTVGQLLTKVTIVILHKSLGSAGTYRTYRHPQSPHQTPNHDPRSNLQEDRDWVVVALLQDFQVSYLLAAFRCRSRAISFTTEPHPIPDNEQSLGL